jgi:hypothetical protein
MTFPIVIRDVIPSGDITMSGIIPVTAEKGRSSGATIAPIVPYNNVYKGRKKKR